MRHLTLPAAAIAATALFAACSTASDDPNAAKTRTSASNTPSASPSPTHTDSPSASASPSSADTSTPSSAPATGPSLFVKVKGDKVSPNAQEITVKAGKPLTVSVQSDRPGELHVHSKPEQYIEFKTGRTETKLVIDTPGSVEIEEHDTSAAVALLTVRP